MDQQSVPHADARVIDDLGGSAELARRLGYDEGGTQRVQNWKSRGIPPRVRLERPDIFGMPQAPAKKAA